MARNKSPAAPLHLRLGTAPAAPGLSIDIGATSQGRFRSAFYTVLGTDHRTTPSLPTHFEPSGKNQLRQRQPQELRKRLGDLKVLLRYGEHAQRREARQRRRDIDAVRGKELQNEEARSEEH